MDLLFQFARQNTFQPVILGLHQFMKVGLFRHSTSGVFGRCLTRATKYFCIIVHNNYITQKCVTSVFRGVNVYVCNVITGQMSRIPKASTNESLLFGCSRNVAPRVKCICGCDK